MNMPTTKVEAIEPPANADAEKETAVEPKLDTSTIDRLLEESKAWKAKAKASQSELEKIKANTLQEQGKYKELYEGVLKEKEELAKQSMTKDITTAVKEAAAKAGAIDLDAVVRLGDMSALEYDPANGEVHGVTHMIDKLKKDRHYLFSTAKPAAVNPATPGGADIKKTLTATDVAKLPTAQKSAMWALALGAKK